MHNFKELNIWKKSIELAQEIYSVMADYPNFEKFGLTNQMRRAVVSIPSNIAEGSGRASNKDFRRFLSISLSSAYELETQLIFSEKLGFITDEQCSKLTGDLNEIQKMVYGFRKSLK
jgi:four helix bundle protein